MTPARIKTDPPAALTPESVRQLDTAALRELLASGITGMADSLARSALAWAELERRGEDLSDLRRGLTRYVPLIASAQLAAEAVVAYANRPTLLDALRGMPLAEQRALAAGRAVEVIDPADPSAVNAVPLVALPAAVIRLVVSDGQVRTPAQQRLAFRPRPKKEKSSRHFRPRYDRETGAVQVGRMSVSLADLMVELSSAAGPDHVIPADMPAEYKTVRLRLTDAEYARLQAAAGKTELPDWELARKALRAFGLI